jgi:hypothetical protein
MRKTPFTAVQEATEVVVGHLDGLPPTGAADLLRTRVQDCLREAERWSTSPPDHQERDGLMTRVLALYVEVMKLERDALRTADLRYRTGE